MKHSVILASCVRVAYVRKMQNNPDVTWTQASAAVWSSVELPLGIICNCLAQLKPFVRKHLPMLNSLVGGTNSKNSYPNQYPTGSNFMPWRGDGADHGYELNSLNRSKRPDGNVPSNPKDIVVVDEYQVQYSNTRGTDAASSTENILVSGGHQSPERIL